MDIMEAIKERRSIKFFEPEMVISEVKIRELLAAASLAPSSFDLQPWRAIVVNRPDTKAALRLCAFNQPKVEECSFVVIVVADPSGVEANTEQTLQSMLDLGYILKEEHKEPYRGMIASLYGEPDSLRRKLFAVKNASLFAMNLMLAARGFGYETTPMDGFDDACIKEQFGIPEDKLIPMIVAVGYPKKGFDMLPRPFRMDMREFVSFNSY
jgi:nitroreductase